MGVLFTYLYAIIGIIVVGLFFLFLWLLCRLLEQVMRRRMASCDTAIQANRIRSNINNARKIVTIATMAIVSFIVVVVISFWPLSGDVSYENYLRLFFSIFLVVCFLPFMVGFFHGLDGNISPCQAEDILESDAPFSLFLRAFILDDTTKIRFVIENKVNKKRRFSEYLYCKGKANIFAVGNPEEVDAPFGAPRVYLDTVRWKEQLLKLLDRASTIHIKVCNTPSCIWELNQALSQKERLTLIIDSIEEYNQVRNIISSLPQVHVNAGKDYATYFVTFDENKTPTVRRYRKTDSGYVEILDPKDDGVPVRFRKSEIPHVTKGAIFIIALYAFTVPYLSIWFEKVAEDEQIKEDRKLSIAEWISDFNGKMPIELNESVSAQLCYSCGDSIVFVMNRSQGTQDEDVFPVLMDSLFKEGNPYRNHNKEAVFHDTYINENKSLYLITYEDSIRITPSVVITEEELRQKYDRLGIRYSGAQETLEWEPGALT